MKDLSGNANQGTFGGSGGSFPYGRYGKAGGFGGAAWIQAADAPSLDTSTFSISVWLYPTVFPTAYNRIVAHDYWTNSQQIGWTLLYDGTSPYGRAYLAVFFGGVGESDSQRMQLSLNSWNHVAVTFDGKNICAYLNGALAGGSCPTASAYAAASGNPLYVGAGVANGLFSYYTGNIDEVRIFSRSLSSEEVAVLYNKNSLKRGEQQNWYSVNDMPHLVEGFVGDQTTASVVTRDGVDDWGNQIYHRDALGNETFASYANTDHQSHFYAPGSLAKIASGPTFSTEFIDFGNGQFPTGQGDWTVNTEGGGGSVAVDYSMFDKIAPSLKITAPSSFGYSTWAIHTLVTPAPTFIEFRARIDALKQFTVYMADSSNNQGGGIRIKDTSGRVSAYTFSSGLYNDCSFPNGIATTVWANEWHRFTIQIDYDATNFEWKIWMDGIDLSCGTTLTLSGFVPVKVQFMAYNGISWNAWIDDIKLYKNNCGVGSHCTHYSALDVGFDGLQPRQSIRLLAEDGSVIDQMMQTVSGTTLWLSFNSALTGAYSYYENGDNAKTLVQIYAEDGTLEYQSPLTRFFVGERYTYARPRAFADEVSKGQSGALSWQLPVFADDDCAGITCPNDGSWVWKSSPDVRGALRGTKVHVTPFDYGSRAHYFSVSGQTNPSYFVTYVRIPARQAPDGIGLLFEENPSSPNCATYCWHQAYWGIAPAVPSFALGFDSQTSMGPVPAMRDQWIELIVSLADSGLRDNWVAFGYNLAGGAAEWDVTTTQTSSTESFIVGVPTSLGSNLKVSIYDSSKNVVVASASASTGVAGFNLYKLSSNYNWDTFPVQANIKICSSTSSGCDGSASESAEYYFGPLRNLWPGDMLDYSQRADWREEIQRRLLGCSFVL